MPTTLRILRVKRDETAVSVGQKLKINATIMSNLETCKQRATPRQQQVLAEYYDVPIASLFDERGFPLMQ